MDEQEIRAELARRAAGADVSGPARDRVLRGVRRRRGWVTPTLGAAAAVAVTIVGLSVIGGPDPAPPAPDPAPAPAAEGWREESWQGLTVSVPDDWGWSSAPIGRNLLCDEKPEAPGYVGRPIGLSDACGTYVEGQFPNGQRAPYVWLGTQLEPGTVDLPTDGWVQETVVAEGVTLTVASDDAGLRAEIIDSAQPTGLCEPQLSGPPQPRWDQTFEGGIADATGLTVCAYRRETGNGPPLLTYAVESDDVAALAYDAITADGQARLRCASDQQASEWVVLHFTGPDPYGPDDLTHDVVLHLAGAGCPRAELGDGTAYRLTPETVAPWATGGIPSVLVGPTGGKGAMLDSFIGILG